MMEDIVDRLRVLNFKGPWQEAADEIDRLRKALQDVLKKEYVADCKDVARAALKEGE
jgi:hypothetical protein